MSPGLSLPVRFLVTLIGSAAPSNGDRSAGLTTSCSPCTTDPIQLGDCAKPLFCGRNRSLQNGSGGDVSRRRGGRWKSLIAVSPKCRASISRDSMAAMRGHGEFERQLPLTSRACCAATAPTRFPGAGDLSLAISGVSWQCRQLPGQQIPLLLQRSVARACRSIAVSGQTKGRGLRYLSPGVPGHANWDKQDYRSTLKSGDLPVRWPRV